MRAQTTLDFAIGIALFLGVLLFVFTFVPGILEPFEIPDEEDPALSDRIAGSLSQGTLGSPEHPYVLDRYCTVEFFDGNAPDGCNFSGNTTREQLNLEPWQSVNISLEGNVTGGTSTEQLCWERDDNEPGLNKSEYCDPNNDDVLLTVGDERPDDRGATITARRIVSVGGESVTMRVVLW